MIYTPLYAIIFKGDVFMAGIENSEFYELAPEQKRKQLLMGRVVNHVYSLAFAAIIPLVNEEDEEHKQKMIKDAMNFFIDHEEEIERSLPEFWVSKVQYLVHVYLKY